MLTFKPDGIEDFAAAHTDAPSELLERLREETYKSIEMPGMQVGRLEGAFLRMLAKMISARRALEIGMFTGYSGLCIAEGLADDGELVTCDVNPKAEAIARRYFAQSPHGKKIQIRMGPALETIKILKGPFDLVFIDADKVNYPAYYDAVFPLVRSGGLIVGDNTLWSGKVLDPKTDDDRGIVEYDRKVSQDPRVERVLLTVRDGILVARKR
jgi:caffeoyl-CoA O-methyltransferase